MEINRIRAKEIRKRKKQMEVDMQQQIIKLTLENNQLRSQIKIQEAEIKLLRDSQQTINVRNFLPSLRHDLSFMTFSNTNLISFLILVEQ